MWDAMWDAMWLLMCFTLCRASHAEHDIFGGGGGKFWGKGKTILQNAKAPPKRGIDYVLDSQ